MSIKSLDPSEERRRNELLRLKDKFNLSNQGITGILPIGTGTKKSVDNWTAGHRPVPVLILDVLRFKLEGAPITSRNEK